MEYEIKPMESWWHLENSVSLAGFHVPQAGNIRKEMLHPDAFYFVAMYGSRVIGFGGVKKTGINKSVWEIPWCVVHPDFRGNGIGGSITSICIAHAVANGCKAIFLSTPEPKLYTGHGFKVIGELPGDHWAKHLMLLVIE